MKPTLITIALSALAICSACSGNESKDVAVPRPEAFPRIHLLTDSGFTAIEGLPVHMEVNTLAKVESAEKKADGNVWITLSYPTYGALVYFTLTPVDSKSFGSVILNRTERMEMNLNGAQHADSTFHTPGGFQALIVKSPFALSTPVQFLAHDNSGWIVSGSVFFPKPPTAQNTDSVAPIVDALSRDIQHSLNSLAAN